MGIYAVRSWRCSLLVLSSCHVLAAVPVLIPVPLARGKGRGRRRETGLVVQGKWGWDGNRRQGEGVRESFWRPLRGGSQVLRCSILWARFCIINVSCSCFPAFPLFYSLLSFSAVD